MVVDDVESVASGADVDACLLLQREEQLSGF